MTCTGGEDDGTQILNQVQVSLGLQEEIVCTFTNRFDSQPVAVNDSVTTPETQPVEIDVLANDRHGGDFDSLSLQSVDAPAHGRVVISGDCRGLYADRRLYWAGPI